jgi:hypothetical protein
MNTIHAGRQMKKPGKPGNKTAGHKPYRKPELMKLGALQEITLGSSQIGTGDSGNPTQYDYNP